jgi:hypothetical protein
MVDTPCLAERGQFVIQRVFDASQIRELEAITLPQFRWALWAIQHKYGFATRTPYVDMRGPMIIRVNHCAQAGKAKDGGHAAK